MFLVTASTIWPPADSMSEVICFRGRDKVPVIAKERCLNWDDWRVVLRVI